MSRARHASIRVPVVTEVTTPSLFARYSLSTTPQLTLMTQAMAYGQRRSILRRSSRDANVPHPDSCALVSPTCAAFVLKELDARYGLVRLLCWMRVAVFKW